MRLSVSLLTCVFLAVVVGACGEEETVNGEPDGAVTGACVITGHNSPDTAIPLTLAPDAEAGAGVLTATYPGPEDVPDSCIYPLQMQRWFSVDLPADTPLLSVSVAFPPQAKSKVNLAYQIFAAPVDQATPLGGDVDTTETVHASRVGSTHYLGAAGTYFIMVHDAGDNAQDDLNIFTLSLRAAADPDPNEGQAGGNNECANAVDVGSGQTGYIAYQGDHDAFKVNVPAGAQILEITLDYAGTQLMGRLKAELYNPDLNTLAYEDTAGSSTPALYTRRGLTSPGGDYCIIVRDFEDTAADPENPFTITVQVLNEPDANESPTRNDLPNNATDLGGGGSVQGYIASTGDSDWYAVHQTPGELIEVRAQGAAGSAVSLGMTLVYPHDTTSCTPGVEGESCAYLTGTEPCVLPTDCNSSICQDGYCALFCNTNLDCPSLFCSAHACAAAGVCLPEGQCAVTQYIKSPSVDSPNDVHTQQPAMAPVTYVLVHDSPPAGTLPRFDESSPYTFTFAAHAEPDAAEADNFYNPFLTLESPDTDPRDVLEANRDFNPRDLPMNATVGGYISYEGDIDVWRFQNPCGSGDCGLYITYNRPGGLVDYVYFVYSSGFGLKFSWRAADEGSETVFGDGACGVDPECAFYYTNNSGYYYLIVRDWYHDKWDITNSYTISVDFAAGCPGADGIPGGCQRYEGTGNCYACN